MTMMMSRERDRHCKMIEAKFELVVILFPKEDLYQIRPFFSTTPIQKSDTLSTARIVPKQESHDKLDPFELKLNSDSAVNTA